MIFKDYYRILGIGQDATQNEIKSAFKTQAVKWHPDKNPEVDTTFKMQDINEAYLILKDEQARRRYDIEYNKYLNFNQDFGFQEQKDHRAASGNHQPYSKQQEEYEFEDEILKKWMQNARKQAVDLAIQTIKEMSDLSVQATKAAGTSILLGLSGYFFSALVLYILFKACS